MTAPADLAIYRLEGGPHAGPIHWSTAWSLAKQRMSSVCITRDGVWHRYQRSVDPHVFIWQGACDQDHHDLEVPFL